MKFDFAILNSNGKPVYFIEYDGEQHFIDKFYGNKDLIYRRTRDEMKNNYCKENKIPLIRIPYTHKLHIVIDDLLLTSSKFIFINSEEYYAK